MRPASESDLDRLAAALAALLAGWWRRHTQEQPAVQKTAAPEIEAAGPSSPRPAASEEAQVVVGTRTSSGES